MFFCCVSDSFSLAAISSYSLPIWGRHFIREEKIIIITRARQYVLFSSNDWGKQKFSQTINTLLCLALPLSILIDEAQRPITTTPCTAVRVDLCSWLVSHIPPMSYYSSLVYHPSNVHVAGNGWPEIIPILPNPKLQLLFERHEHT